MRKGRRVIPAFIKRRTGDEHPSRTKPECLKRGEHPQAKLWTRKSSRAFAKVRTPGITWRLCGVAPITISRIRRKLDLEARPFEFGCQCSAQVCPRIGLSVPNAVATSQDSQIIDLLALANAEGEDLRGRYPWQAIVQESTYYRCRRVTGGNDDRCRRLL